MGDAAAFKATFAGMNSLTDGDYSIRFHVSGENVNKLFAILTHGEKPSVAKGTWFAIARLKPEEPGEARFSRPTTADGSTLQRVEGTAPGEVTAPARSLSQHIYKRVCMQPRGRKFIEECFQDILRGEPVNDAERAKDAINRRLGIVSLSEVDSDPVASEQAEQLLNWFAGWERGYDVEAPQKETVAQFIARNQP